MYYFIILKFVYLIEWHVALVLNISELNRETLSDNYKWYEFFDFDVPNKDDPPKMVLGET